MFELWSSFAADFARQGAVARLAFLLPFLGIPSLGAIFGTLVALKSSRARLRASLARNREEVAELRADLARLERASLSNALLDYRLGTGSDDLLLAAFAEAKPDIVETCEAIAHAALIQYHEHQLDDALETCARYARAAHDLDGKSWLARLLLDEVGIARRSREDWLETSIAAGRSHAFEREVAAQIVRDLLRQVDGAVAQAEYEEAFRLAAHANMVVAESLLANTSLDLDARMRLAAVFIHEGRRARGEGRSNRAGYDLICEVLADAPRFCSRTDGKYLAFLWHRILALDGLDRQEEALRELDQCGLLEQAHRHLGERDNVTIATRSLRVELLAALARHEEAKAELVVLMADLTRWKIGVAAQHPTLLAMLTQRIETGSREGLVVIARSAAESDW